MPRNDAQEGASCDARRRLPKAGAVGCAGPGLGRPKRGRAAAGSRGPRSAGLLERSATSNQGLKDVVALTAGVLSCFPPVCLHSLALRAIIAAGEMQHPRAAATQDLWHGDSDAGSGDAGHGTPIPAPTIAKSGAAFGETNELQ